MYVDNGAPYAYETMNFNTAISQMMIFINAVYKEKWPEYDEAKTIDEMIEIPVQINGKVKVVVTASKDVIEEEVKKL